MKPFRPLTLENFYNNVRAGSSGDITRSESFYGSTSASCRHWCFFGVLYTAIQEQAGLKLESKKPLAQVLVVEHVEKSTQD